MSLQEVFAEMQKKNIVVSELDGELVIRAPQGAVDQALMSTLKTHKQDLLIAIRNGVVMDRHASGTPKITPDMLPLLSFTQDEIDLIVASVAEGVAGIQDIYPLAPLQEGILFHHLMETRGDPYITRSVIVFDNRARLQGFLEALQTVIDRHDILRSSIRWNGLSQPVQVVHRHAVLTIEEWAPEPKERIYQCLMERTDPRRLRMDLQKAPLLAGFAIKDSQSDEYWFAMLNHHMVDDNYTLQLILSEIRLILEGRPEQLPAIQPYRNFIARMRALSQADHESYFRRQLGDIDEPTAPFGVLNVQGSGGQVEEAVLSLEAELAQRARNSARQHGVTPASLFHMAWALVLGQCSGRDDVVFGTVLSGRLQGGGIGADSAVGMFINTLPIRVSLTGRTVRDIIGSIYDNLNELLMHEHATLALAQRCSAVPASLPLFTALLNYRHSRIVAVSDQSALLEWEGMRVISSEERTNYPLTLSVDDLGQGFNLTVQCVSGIGPERIGIYVCTAIDSLITALEQCPQQAANTLCIMPEGERRRILDDFNDTAAEYSTEQELHALFEAQVGKTPDAVALVFAEQALSYAELNAKANQLAHYLRSKGIGPDVPVGLCVERSLEMVVGMLGILKAGGAYVPLDPHYPKERVDYMLKDARIAVLLTQQHLAAELAFGIKDTTYLDADWPAIQQYSVDNLTQYGHSLNLAYMIYTSGSTGQPKGVMVSHCNALQSTVARFTTYRAPVTCYLLLSSFAFDSSVAGLFWTLGQGGCLCLPEDEVAKDPVALTELITRYRVSHLLALPSFYGLLVKQAGIRLETLKTAIVAGEACAIDVVNRHYAMLPNVPLYNEYGPTEGSVWSSVYPISQNDLDRPVSIGRPISNVRLYILDRYGHPVPIGVQGELHIGGAGVVRGYWRRPELTAEKFIPDPFQAAGGRLYKTGDLARYRLDGNLEFLGRVDHQVKIRGFRIELGEIEARLMAQPDVEDAVVLASEPQPGNKQLTAYVVGNASTERLRENLKSALPDHMVPNAFVWLERMPLTANGKLNRNALLSAAAKDKVSDIRADTPVSETEIKLAEIWSGLLGVEQIGRHDDFFDLGGHSLLAIELVSAIQTNVGVDVALVDLFECSTLVAQGELIDGSRKDDKLLDLEAEAKLDPEIRPTASTAVPVVEAQAMLLTGATGFLGTFLLAELLEQTRANIYCLIRAVNEGEAQVRLQRQIGRYALQDRIDWSRVIAVCGDLAEPRLGLSVSRYEEIAGRVDAIYHNGAQVNFVQPYQALKAANVLATEAVLRLACYGKAKAVHYVSTLSVFSETSFNNPYGHGEQDEPASGADLANGYAQSKWVAEKLVRLAKDRGIQVTVYRPATVAGDSRSGVWNTEDYLCRLIKGCIQIGYAPAEHLRMDMAPVDYMSRAMVALSLQPSSVGGCFHLNHPIPPYSDELVNGFSRLGYRLHRIPYRDWVNKLLEIGKTQSNDFALLPLLPMFSEQKQDDASALLEEDAIRYDCRATQSTLSELGIECASLDDELLGRYHTYFSRNGFIREPDYYHGNYYSNGC
ncbi:non-ribosomal peptide synthetase [Methylomonas rhizoryzae]|uniref:non-ribosomal peptide synthetase n=1 Tax=Methylomonas rhizoryzae TaxID=2608981 RepID=UPI001232823D|nr:non-ribosomal peptide synthetase [Methylomonas rhizoryzae]